MKAVRKHLLFVFMVNAYCCTVMAGGYDFAAKTQTYSNLSGATMLSQPGWFAETYENVPIGFGFTFFGKTHTSLSAFAYGRISFSNFTEGDAIVPSQAIFRHYTNLAGDVSYITEGTAPGRIFKMQWRNAGFSMDNDSVAYCNIQVWLREGSNIIEIHHGATSGVTNSMFFDGGPLYGLFNYNADTFYCLKGNPASPQYLLNPSSPQTLTGMPASGTVYVYTPKSQGPSLTITSPSGGESWEVNSSQNITWNASGAGALTITYTINGTDWLPVASGIGSSAGTYAWTIPNTVSSTCKVKITDGTLSSVSALFSIVPDNMGIAETTVPALSVYPNPGNGIFRVTGRDGVLNIQVYDICGRQVPASYVTGQNLINLEGLPEGMYQLHIITATRTVNTHIQIQYP